ncbi:MAG: DinB family protein [Saprospiraceae bacterium]|jgi:uncharacterized damage-inducible protein DinB|nr:DinB family protein [Saprospiraceae bacterium]MBL0026252.1 DinB family protein [Saprospiraceae bacterium]
MKKKQINKQPAYFDRYIEYVPDIDLNDALLQYGFDYLLPEKEKLGQLGHDVYSPGKWTIRDILQHIIDTERIFSYRALRIARNDKTPLPGFDENQYAYVAHASGRKLDDLFDEFDMVRKSTIFLFDSLSEQDLLREGFINKSDISVLALGFTITGHCIHHMNVIKERYYPLIGL